MVIIKRFQLFQVRFIKSHDLLRVCSDGCRLTNKNQISVLESDSIAAEWVIFSSFLSIFSQFFFKNVKIGKLWIKALLNLCLQLNFSVTYLAFQKPKNQNNWLTDTITSLESVSNLKLIKKSLIALASNYKCFSVLYTTIFTLDETWSEWIGSLHQKGTNSL